MAFIALKVLQVVQFLHKNNIVHGDINLCNLYMPSAKYKSNEFKKVYDPQCSKWASRHMIALDFDASIDLLAFEKGQTFKIDINPDASISEECFEFRHGKCWIYEPDWYATVLLIHLLLFQKPLETDEVYSDGEKPYIQIQSKFDQGWNNELWDLFFSTMLNLTFKSDWETMLDILCCNFEDYLIENSVEKNLHEELIKYGI